MKKSLLAVGLTMALTSPLAIAGGIQIDPTGTANIGASVFLAGLGNTTGDALLRDLSGSIGNSGVVYGDNAISLASTIGGELTFVFGITSTSVSSGLGGISEGLTKTAGKNYFQLYWNKSVSTNRTTGAGYDDAASGILLASGTASYDTVQPTFVQQITTSPVGPLSSVGGNPTSLIPTVGLNGSMVLNVDFTSQNTSYVVNNLTSLIIDLFVTDTLNAPYNPAFGTASIAPTQVGGTLAGHGDQLLAGGAGVGPDGLNDLSCFKAPAPTQSGTCNVQMQANSTLEFTSQKVPEPTTLALLGIGLGLVGWRVRRKAG